MKKARSSTAAGLSAPAAGGPLSGQSSPRKPRAGPEPVRGAQLAAHPWERAWSALQSAADGIIITNRAGRIQHVNPAAERLTGCSSELVAGRSLTEVLRLEEKRGGFVRSDLVSLAILHGQPVGLGSDLTLCALDGQRRDVEGEIAVTGTGGAVTGTVVTFRDVTAQNRQREEDARNLRLRTAARLAGSVAHDFNDFLTVLLGSADRLQSSLGKDREAGPALEQIRRATAAAGELTQELLSLARTEITFPRTLNLSQLIAEFCPELARTIPENITITTRLDPALVPVRADPDQMRLMITNAILHARRAMPDGGSIQIETENVQVFPQQRGSRIQKFAKVMVVDSRVRAGHAELDDAIERFCQPGAARKVTGTELLILLGIVQDANGRISLKFTPGHGATMEMLFPQEEQEPFLTVENDAKPTLLVIERNADVRALLHGCFDRCGYRVLEAPDAVEAMLLSDFHEGPIDLLIAGSGIDARTGRGVLKKFADGRPETRVLLIAAGSRDLTHMKEFLDRGAQVLRKPFGQKMLLDRVRKILQAPRQSLN